MVVTIVLVVAILAGNILLFIALFDGDISFLSVLLLVVLTVIADLLLLPELGRKIKSALFSSGQLALNGIRRNIKKATDIKEIEKSAQYERNYLTKLRELRSLGISDISTRRTLHFCQLIQILSNDEQIDTFYTEIAKRRSLLIEIRQLETQLLGVAFAYKNTGNLEKAKHILNQINTTDVAFDKAKFDEEYKAEQIVQQQERDALEKWRIGVLRGAAIIVFFLFVSYVSNTPYR